MTNSSPTFWYQIMPDKFAYVGAGTVMRKDWSSPPTESLKHGGTLSGIAEKVEAGCFNWITENNISWGIYLTPIYENTSSYHKYWPEDHWQIDKEIGGVEGLRKLTKALRKKNGQLMVDLVFNHTGITHYFFNDILRYGSSSQYYSYYRKLPDINDDKIQIPILASIKNASEQCRIVHGNTLVINDRFSFPRIGDRIEISSDYIEGEHYKFVKNTCEPNYACWWGLPELPELNTLNENVKEYLFHSVCIYLELGIRNFRIDIPDALPEALNFWREFRNFLKKKVSRTDNKRIYIVGEIWEKEKFATWISANYSDTSPFDAVMNYPFRRAVVSYLSSQNISENNGKEVGKGKWNANKTRQYLNDAWGAFDKTVLLKQLNLLGSHDVTRIGNLIENTQDKKTAFSILFTFPGHPCIYYGDEFGMKGVSGEGGIGARATIKWKTKTDVEIEGESLTTFLSSLLRMRKNFRELESGGFEWYGDHQEVLAFKRYKNNHETIVIAAPSQISSSALVKWIKRNIHDSKYIIHGRGDNIKLIEISTAQIDVIRSELGALVASK